MTHHLCIGWVQVSGAWALCVLHFHVHPLLVYCSCICHDLKACLCILLLILDLLWHEWVSEPLFFTACFLLGLGLAWLWTFLSLIYSSFLSWVCWYFCHTIMSFLLCYCLTRACWLLLGLLYTFPLLNSSGPIVSFGPTFMLFQASLAYSIASGLPWSISSF